jgi:hypothetical protein
MNAFLRISAVLVALCNWYALTVGSSPAMLASYGLPELLTTLLVPVVLGLAAAEIAIRLARKTLDGSFLDRYGAIVATVWIGGMLCGVVLAWGGVLHDEALGIVGTLGFVASLWGIVCGGVLGFAEGLVLGLPLAALLRSFGKENGLEVLPLEVRAPDARKKGGPWSTT